ncbi:hypothetical protein A9Q86_00725 [Flavobacteriales bacterium 33_180_T64]|nr:hypothetical protein A9Q86_00725 [Flavobacteriales bacterium 33_180_T64]
MKTSTFIIITLFIILLASCSSDDTEISAPPTTVLSQFIYENYNTINQPNEVNNRRIYTVENNRIIASENENLSNGTTGNRVFSYSNGKISEISEFFNESLGRIKRFTYDANENLTEFSNEILATTSQNAFYTKENFIHTQDTIYKTTSYSEDDLTYNISSTSKIVLDNTMNRTFIETYTVSNNETSRSINTYDTNNNVISILGYMKQDDGSYLNTILSSYTYETGINTLGLVFEATYGRALLMLTSQHIDNSNGVNYYNSKYITSNTFDTFTSTFFGNVDMSPEFTNTYNSENYSTLSDYQMHIEGNLFSRFTIEYIFE